MKALLMGYYGARNLGDEMMLACLRPWLEKQGFDLTVLSEFPEEVELRHGLPATANFPLFGQWAWKTAWLRGKALGVIRALMRTDVLIVGGGDLIRDDCGWRQFMFTMEKIIFALFLRKKVFLVNAGIGRPRARWSRHLLRWALRRCDRIIVRDQRSLDLCKELGVSKIATLLPDIVLSLPELLDTLVQQPEPSLSERTLLELPGKPYILVSLRGGANSFQLYDLTEARIRTLAHGLDRLVEQLDADIVFLPFHSPVGREIADNRLHARVLSAMEYRTRARLQGWTDDLDKVCGLVRRAQGMIAMRLHAAVLASAFERPAVLMPSDHKVREFGELVGIRALIEPEMLDDADALWGVLNPMFGETGVQSSQARTQEGEGARPDTGSLSRAVFQAWETTSLVQESAVANTEMLKLSDYRTVGAGRLRTMTQFKAATAMVASKISDPV